MLLVAYVEMLLMLALLMVQGCHSKKGQIKKRATQETGMPITTRRVPAAGFATVLTLFLTM